MCQKSKSETEYYANPVTKDRLGSQCKSCDRAGHVLRRREKKRKLVEHFGGECVRCGYKKNIRALDFHHPNDDKEGQVSALMDRGKIEEAYKEAKKCILLCANCHREEHDDDITPEKYSKNWRRRKTKSGGIVP